ncbi:MAG: murein L,D-transpeptidase [Opitutaceae bacterium]|nr:murein L,D-transpeptidase [Opitutaceae bacterium]
MLALVPGPVRGQEADSVHAVALPRPVETVLELQVELHRRGFSCGSIDGLAGAQTAAALRTLQRTLGLPESGVLDAATREQVLLNEPALTEHVFSAGELSGLRPVPVTWLEKSQVPDLAYASALELAAERYRASPRFLQRLNPGVDWANVEPGQTIKVPAVGQIVVRGRAALISIRLEARELEVTDAEGRIIAHFPVSIARYVEKRPLGELRVTVAIPEPNYTFDPAVFPESAEGRELGRKLILPPGPNNPVGRVWIGLDRPGYGIHGTPDPEKVGRTESHGCFRLANWDALTLLKLAWVGLTVEVSP